jgi:putative component of membrane protein insertase Oxa1/YidC/SpoIIIJ protein YidD
MAFTRFLRCAPWGKPGYDPVPEDKHKVQSTKH